MKTASLRNASTPRPGTSDRVLVDPGWLQAHLSDPRVRVVEVDVSPAAYDDWHIDGAVLWNIYADLKDLQLLRAQRPGRAFEQQMNPHLDARQRRPQLV